MAIWSFFFWTLGLGTLFALLSLISSGSSSEDAYDFYIYLAKAQRAFLGGCAVGIAIWMYH
jgi:hypothetical protein